MCFPKVHKYISLLKIKNVKAKNAGFKPSLIYWEHQSVGWIGWWQFQSGKRHEQVWKSGLVHAEILCTNAENWFFVRKGFINSNLEEWHWPFVWLVSGEGLVVTGVTEKTVRSPKNDYPCA